MSDTLDLFLVQETINHHLNEIAGLFKAPKITLVVRAPNLPDGDLVMTADDLDQAVAAIQRLKERGPS